MAALKTTWALTETYAHTDQNITAIAVNGLNGAGVYSSRPSASFPGRRYDCTENGNTYQDNGTSWDLISVAGSGSPGVEPPGSSWSTTTLGSATFTAVAGQRLLTCPSAVGDNWRIEFRTLTPTSNYTFTTYLEHHSTLADVSYSGMVLRNSSSGSFVVFGPELTATTGIVRVRAMMWNSVTSFSADYGTPRSVAQLPGAIIPKWYRIRDDGTNRIFEHSMNGSLWFPFASTTRTNFITPDQVGWGLTNGTGLTAWGQLSSWSVV